MDPKVNQRSFICQFFPTLCFLYAAIFMGSLFLVSEYKQTFLGWGVVDAILHTGTGDNVCKTQCRSYGTEALPRGIVSGDSDLEMRPLWGEEKKKSSKPMNLLAMAVGIKQKESVDTIVKKFPSSDFVIMLFHYDGNVNDWREFEWSDQAIHVSAVKQTKWWFAKRFLHPDIVSEYAYIFLWDEDLGVQNFHAGRYISIIKEEGLEISQPGLDPDNSELHHHLTARDKSSRVHRRVYKKIGPRQCDENSTTPPCTGFVEMMAPVFSRAAWRCVWHMIQNDLVHGWGLDFELGYCAQGDRTKNIGIVDSEYVVHYGLPTLGGSSDNKTNTEAIDQAAQVTSLPPSEQSASSPEKSTGRSEVRKQSYLELERFKNRWKKAVKDDSCWVNPYQLPIPSPKHRKLLSFVCYRETR